MNAVRVCLAAVLMLLAACTSMHAANTPPTLQSVALAPGVYAVQGTSGVPDEYNLGRIGNAGFVVGERGVVAIDTGTSYAHGQALLAAITSVTDKPVRLAIVTHTRAEFLFGGAAFRERGIPVRMHAATAKLMAARCETCLKTLRQTLGDEPMRGTAMYVADQTFDATHTLDLIGRPLRVLHFGHSSGPGDSAVFDEQSGVLFAGGLLDHERIPDIQDADLTGWRLALEQLRALPIRRIVPGHGPATVPTLIDSVQRYLQQLETRTRALLQGGTSLADAIDAANLPEFSRWDQYDTIHRRNASIAYLRFEREAFLK